MPINKSIVCLGAQEKSSQLVAVLGVYGEEHRIHLFDAGTVVKTRATAGIYWALEEYEKFGLTITKRVELL